MSKYNEYPNATGLRTGDMFLMYRPDTNTTENIYADDFANSIGYMASGRNFTEEAMSTDVWLNYRQGNHGAYQHVNRNLLDSFTRKLATGTGLITALHGGFGLVSYQPYGMIQKPFDKMIQGYGMAGNNAFPFNYGFLGGPAAFITDRNYWFNYSYTKITGNNGYVDQRSYYNYGDGYHKTSNFDIYYMEGPLAGGFSVYSGKWNDSNPPWTFVTGINASQGVATSGCRKLSITGGLEYRQWRISGTGNPLDLRIINSDMYNTTGRIRKVRYENNGSNIHMIVPDSGIRTNIRNTVFSGWNPDIMIFSFVGTNDDTNFGTFTTTGLAAWMNDLRTTFPSCPVLICGTYGISPNYTRDSLTQRRYALNNGFAYFDADGAFNGSGAFLSRGFGIANDVHHTQSGAYAYSNMLDSWFNVLGG